MEAERWVKIKGYEAYYEISNFGRVKSLSKKWAVGKKSDTILKSGNRKSGYLFVVLCVDKKKKYVSIHRIVAEHFCCKKDDSNVVNHLNSIRSDNRAINLEWTTTKGNAEHSFKYGHRIGKTGEKNHFSKLKEDDIKKIKMIYSKKQITQKSIASLYGVLPNTISRIISGKRWKHIY